MVCQAASQTRFRALKHENGIAGKPRIIVRVIACFQPLQDCQVCYLAWMFRAQQSQPSPENVVWQPPNSNDNVTLTKPKPLPLPEQINKSISMFTAYDSLPGLIDPCFSRTRTGQDYEANRVFNCFPYQLQTVPQMGREYVPETLSRSSPENARKVSANAASKTLQKKFLIFDHSGNTTRLIYDPGFLFFQNQPTATQSLFHIEKGYQNNATKFNLLDQGDHNHLIAEESEMHEDTEEINALLYSDDEDEVTSTCHFPLGTKETLYQESFKDMNEEVASSNAPNKRQKLVDGWSKGASVLDTTCSVQMDETQECHNDAESRYYLGGKQNITPGVTEDEIESKEVNVPLKRDKIRETIKALEKYYSWYKRKAATIGY